jgi:hypothetical protein
MTHGLMQTGRLYLAAGQSFHQGTIYLFHLGGYLFFEIHDLRKN